MKIKLLEYDKSKSFLQVREELNRVLDAREIRVSEELWMHLITTTTDQDFLDNIDTNKTANDLKHGLVADAFGVKVTTEIIIKNHTRAQPLYGMYYMLFYKADVVEASATSTQANPPDLLALAQQVTQP